MVNIFFCIFVTLFSISAFAMSDCEIYLGALLEEQVLSLEELKSFVEKLEAGEFENPIPLEKAMVSSKHLIHRQHIESIIGDNYNDKEKLKILTWAKQRLGTRLQDQESREEVQTQTVPIARKMKFNNIPPGQMSFGAVGKIYTAIFDHEIEVMDTPVTQAQWLEIMGENPSFHTNGPDHPVENITWYSALEFANALSRKEGLREVYDLSKLKFNTGGRASAGTLEDEHYSLQTVEIIAPDNDYYKAEGYRLPTVAEQEYLISNLGSYPYEDEAFFFGGAAQESEDYAWTQENSENQTHPVASLKPVLLNGQNFYDLGGNVEEMAFDDSVISADWEQDIAIHNPVSDIANSFLRLTCGGSFLRSKETLRVGRNGTISRNDRMSNVGLRLVRTVR